LGWAWALTLVAGAILYLFVELAWAAQAGAPRQEGRRLRRARDAGISLALLLLLVVTLNFVFNRLSWQWDLGYFHAALPSGATKENVRRLEAPLSVALFFPEGNPVLALVRDYFAELEGLSPHLQIAYYDAELNPEAARLHRARRNGMILISREAVQRDISLGLTLDAAGSQLVKLDSTFLAKLFEVTRPKHPAYLTVGHGERNEAGQDDLPIASRVTALEAILRAQNYTVKSLGLVEGLGSDVPADAGLVLVVGPRFPFRAEEADALARYVERGGRLMLFLEPDAGFTPGIALPPRREGPPLAGLLERFGAKFVASVQANDRIYGRRTQTKADHALLATNRYQAHPAVKSLRIGPSQFPLLFLGTGAFELGQVPEHLRVSGTIQAMPGTWSDADGDFTFQEERETRGEPILAVAISPKNPPKEGAAAPPEPRVLAFADADVAADLFIQNRANQLALLDGIAWLAGDAAAAPTEAEDLKIQHLKGDELIWFYLPVFGVPALVLLAGFLFARRAGPPLWRGGHV
jgi:hypothetical protein